jgi:hypothetical protein
MGPYEITRIEGPNLVFIPKFEVGGKVFVKKRALCVNDLES